VLFTGAHAQLVVMCLKPGEDIGLEVHNTVDQFFRVEQGVGQATLNGEVTELSDGTALIVPAGVEHNLSNTGSTELKLYTVYSPPNHPEGTIHETREDALRAEH
jgi:mannose-6-phosphate isomerase-like protein (cupin superfamily)